MIGAARSGRQNIIEGSERSATSKETEIKLTDVARASLLELLGDYEIYLASQGAIPWGEDEPERRKLVATLVPQFEASRDQLHEFWVYYHDKLRPLFAKWLDSDNHLIVANAMIVLILRATGMLSSQLKAQGEEFTAEGGFRERMTKVRIEARDSSEEPDDTPLCPLCGKKMVLRNAKRGNQAGKPFWGCSSYPNCRGTREA